MRQTLLLPLPFLALLAGCAESPRDSRIVDSRPPVSVETVPVAAEDWPSLYETTGTVRARTSTVVSARLMGYVREVKVQTGDRVREGQILLGLDARELDSSARRAAAARDELKDAIPEADSAVAAVKASLDLDQATFRRMRELYDKKSISDHEFDETSAKLKSSQAAYEMARARRSQLDAKLAQAGEDVRAAEVARGYTEVVAPFAGIITAKSVDPGTLAVPGAPLMTIEREGAYRLEADVEESHIGAIRAGQTASVALDGIGPAVEARVSEIVPAVDASSRSYIVRIDLPPLAGVRSGLFGRAAFQLGRRPVTAIPVGAMIERGQLQSVMVDDNGVARTRLIAAGQKNNARVEVLSGLNAGEKVIFPIPPGLEDGTPVKSAGVENGR